MTIIVKRHLYAFFRTWSFLADCPLKWKGGLKAASADGFSPKHMHIQTTRAIAKKRRHGFPLLWKRLKSDIVQISVTKQKLRSLKLLVLLEWKKSKLQDLHCQLSVVLA